MFDQPAAHQPATIGSPSTRPRRYLIAAVLLLALVLGVLVGFRHGTAEDSGLAACSYPLSTQAIPAAEYPKIRAEFTGSRWPDLRTAGTAYADLAEALLTAHGTDGYQTVWFYQRLSAACAQHGQP